VQDRPACSASHRTSRMGEGNNSTRRGPPFEAAGKGSAAVGGSGAGGPARTCRGERPGFGAPMAHDVTILRKRGRNPGGLLDGVRASPGLPRGGTDDSTGRGRVDHVTAFGGHIAIETARIGAAISFDFL